ncbi:hypothetical protein [uncultured Sunxiuqinia sp.]|uniref:hypothetical protein n=1 Tax=uncultured Sunxiuqinia sp. TaxID=1573825 RepID=UPI00260827E6|nr:hypothetical protein [uncultured Sunxiuqinia sp.]
MELLSPSPKPVIPWQGTVLGLIGVAQILFSILFFFVIMLGLTVGGLFSAFALPDVESLLPSLAIGSIGVLVVIFGLPFFILKVLVTIGLFRGKRWTVIVTIVFAALGLMMHLGSFNLFWLTFTAIELGLAIVCLRDPFYNQNNPAYRPHT